MHIEESRREADRDGLIMPVHLDAWEDDWKR
jgi:hypothetical protein